MKSQADYYYDAEHIIGHYNDHFHVKRMFRGPSWLDWFGISVLIAGTVALPLWGEGWLFAGCAGIILTGWCLFLWTTRRRFGTPRPKSKTAQFMAYFLPIGLDEPILHRQGRYLHKHLLAMKYTRVSEVCALRKALGEHAPSQRQPISAIALLAVGLVATSALGILQETLLEAYPKKRVGVYCIIFVISCLGIPVANMIGLSGYRNKIRRLCEILDSLLLDANVRFPDDGMHPQHPTPETPEPAGIKKSAT